MTNGGGRLRILQVHCHSAPGWGGEDTVVELEAQLLRDRGHPVEQYTASAAALKKAAPWQQILAVPGFFWSQRSYQGICQKIREFQPNIMHVHSTFPAISPCVFWAGYRARVPVVQTLHNFRHVCANALLLREGKRCEKCVGRSPLPGLRHRCYAQSSLRTAVVSAIGVLHRRLGTYTRAVDSYIILNHFNREIFVRGGLPDHKLVVKPNFVPSSQLGYGPRKTQAVYAGELTRSKGIPLLLEAWRIAAVDGFDLLLIGDSPERSALEQEFADVPRVTWCGRLSRPEVLKHIAASRILVFPSLAYENCPMVLLEALSVATPIVLADHPGLRTIVRHGREGLLFESGSSDALASALREGLLANDHAWREWSLAARLRQVERFGPDANYVQLISIYHSAMQKKSGRLPMSQL